MVIPDIAKMEAGHQTIPVCGKVVPLLGLLGVLGLLGLLGVPGLVGLVGS